MARKSREEKVLLKAETLIENTKDLDENNLSLLAYEELFIEYRKLSKRYNKSIKLNDSMGSQIMKFNDILEENNKNIIKVSREKILSTATEKRNMQEEFAKKIEALEDENTSSSPTSDKEIYSLRKENKLLKQKAKEIEQLLPNIETVLEKEIHFAKKHQEPLSLAIIGIDGFREMAPSIINFTTIENFKHITLNYLNNSTTSNDIISYFKGEKFYIISRDTSLEQMELKCKTLGKKRFIQTLNVSMSSGVVQLKKVDTSNSFLSRCTDAYNRAKAIKKDASVVAV